MNVARELSLPPRSSCLLLGPRQTGKSTLVRSKLEKGAFTVDLLGHDVFLRYSKEPGLFRREAELRIRRGARTVFVDEVQKVPALLDEVHALLQATETRFVLTGSSARKLRRGGTNLLAGRAALRRLHPLTLREQGDHFDLGRTLRLGSLPPVVFGRDEEAVDLLKTYAETYLREEILAEAVVRNVGAFGRFLDVAAAQAGDLLSYSAIARDAGVATRTVSEYFQILEDTLLGFRLEPWSKSPRARMVSHPRFYFFDTGVLSALQRRLTAPVDPRERGRLFEHWIVQECRARIDYAGSEARLFFWRTHNGAEVDLLIEKHGKLRVAIEIKAGRRIAAADVSGLRSFGDAHPGVPRVVVTTAGDESLLGELEVLPYRAFLERLPEWL
jgi:predicted AAA+ superfamily ATPase